MRLKHNELAPLSGLEKNRKYKKGQVRTEEYNDWNEKNKIN